MAILENFSWKDFLWMDEASDSNPAECTDAQTCVSRCEEFYSERNGCACDKDCSLFGDCCMDYFLQCVANISDPLTNTEETKPITSNIKRSMKNVLEEILKMKFDSDHKGKQHCFNTAVKDESSTQGLNLQMVAECPRGSVQEEHEKCIGQFDTDLLMHIPLYDRLNKQIYRNIFCAKCHNRDTNHVELFGLELNCDHSNGDVAKNLWRQKGTGAFWLYVTQKCQLTYELPRTLLSDSDLIKRYNCETQNRRCVFQSSSENSVLCWLFRKPNNLTDENSCEQFENIFCVGCSIHGFDGKNKTIQNIFPLSKTQIDNTFLITSVDSVTKIKILVTPAGSVTLKYGLEVICQDGTFLDEETNVCKAVMCASTKSDRECVKKFDVKQILTAQVTNYAIVLQTSRNVSNSVTKNVIKLFSYAGIVIKNTMDCNTEELIGLQHSKFRSCSMLIVNDSLCWEPKVLMDNAKSVVRTSNDSLSLRELRFSLIHTYVEKDVRFQCVTGRKVKRSGVILNKSGTEFLYISLTKLMYKLSDVPFMVDLEGLEGNADNIVDALICEPQILSCETKIIYAKDYQSNNLSITLIKANIDIDQFSHVKLENGKALICSVILPTVEEEAGGDFPAALELSLAGGILSIVGCVMTFVTYCLFPSLRNIPGKIVMNLCIALAIAQLVIALSVFFTFHDIACKISGINKQFWWISSFCWMNIFGYDLSKTFSNLSKIPTKVNERKMILLYCTYGWGLPVLYTTACFVVDYADVQDGFHFGGSDDGFCWIQPRMGFFLTFGIPLIVILILNATFFMRSVVGLCSAMRVARKAKKSSSHKSDAMNLLLYIRIASVMGFNWFFAILLAWIDEPALFYLHVICNSLQGVFIFTCFCANKRVWNMYKEFIFSERPMKRIQSDSSVSKNSTSTSNGTISVALSTKSKGCDHDVRLCVANSRV